MNSSLTQFKSVEWELCNGRLIVSRLKLSCPNVVAVLTFYLIVNKVENETIRHKVSDELKVLTNHNETFSKMM